MRRGSHYRLPILAGFDYHNKHTDYHKHDISPGAMRELLHLDDQQHDYNNGFVFDQMCPKMEWFFLDY